MSWPIATWKRLFPWIISWVIGVPPAKAAARAGQVDVLKWLHARLELNCSSICTAAAKGNQLDTLRWPWLQTVCGPPCPSSQDTMSAAASGGYLDIMK